jgi:spermidine synthase
MLAGQWTVEDLAPGEVHCHRITRRLHTGRTRFQTVEVAETEGYGVGLFLDGRIQHVAADEYVYSEVMVHPAMILLEGTARRVLVVGGGPGGVIRELLRHNCVAAVTQVEIDPEVVRLSRTFFPHISAGCWDDPRVSLVLDDVRAFLARTEEEFDLILFDVSEPLQGAPADGLFGLPMLRCLGEHLSPGGLFVTWAGSAGPRSAQLAVQILQCVRAVFPHVAPLLCHTQSYGTSWLTLLAGRQPLDPFALDAREVDARLSRQVEGNLRLYDGITHLHLFHLPRDVRALLGLGGAFEKGPDR